MARISLCAALVAATMVTPVYAQTGSENALRAQNANSDGLLNKGHLAPTGATVPRPNISDEAAPTLTGRSIHDDSDRVLRGICKNC
ncbi:hypothetical protein [Methylocella silvestris]|uniref:hypothetical protein n=1 Tax=Methylocella silvestris TaxID=199596 RepID=UPI0011AF444F|nr:hypothetical protein [Methylocella silvestris]